METTTVQEEIFCQSCYMAMTKIEDFGTESCGGASSDYCCHCYADGDFKHEMTLDEAVEANVPWWRNEGDESDELARMRIREVFPKLKRWSDK